MEIVWNGNVNKIPFEAVDIGDTFIYNKEIFMKTNDVCNGENRIVNAIEIGSGIIVTFWDDEYVTPIKGKFVMD